MLAIARRRLYLSGCAVTLWRGTAEAPPLRDGCADLVIMASMLHYLPKPGVALCQATRVLRDGGRIAIADYMVRGMNRRMADWLIHRYDHGHCRTRTVLELRGLLRVNGLDVLASRCFPVSPLLRGVMVIARPLHVQL